jgi:hypothetical protein
MLIIGVERVYHVMTRFGENRHRMVDKFDFFAAGWLYLVRKARSDRWAFGESGHVGI